MRLTILITLLSAVAASAAPVPSGIQGFLKEHCYDCHDADVAKNNLNLAETVFDFDNPGNAALWGMVHDRVEKGEMPPKNHPSAAEIQPFLKSLNQHLAQHELAMRQANGRARIRRMSRNEYQATLQDLLALPHLDIENSLPPEGSAYGYDKAGEALDYSHVHAAKLLEVADKALRMAIAPSATKPTSAIKRVEIRGKKEVRLDPAGFNALLRLGNAIPLNGISIDTTIKRDRGNFQKRQPGKTTDFPPYFDGLGIFVNSESNLGLVIKGLQPAFSGYYKIRVNGFGIYNKKGELAPSDRIETVGLYSLDRKIGKVDLPSYKPTTAEITAWLDPDDVIKPMVDSSPFEQLRVGGKLEERFRAFTSQGVAFSWFELEGPINDSWPPESHKRLFGDLPVKTEIIKANRRNKTDQIRVADVVSKDPMKDARRLLRQFMGNALRRPVTGEDMKIPMAVTMAKLRQKTSFMESMIAGYRAILTSPDFLLMHSDPGKLTDRALAERLSYFLWNSTPDQRLRSLSNKEELSNPTKLRFEVERLLRDERSDRFISHFLGKWLKLEDIALTEPDKNLYPDYTPLLMTSSLEESHAYFRELITKNLGASHVIDSDFAMVNQRLAELYKIPGVNGSHIRRVALKPNSVRGGFLTQASLLKTTANGTVTSPVVRGAYLMTHILGDPPPPPPPSVPAVEPDISGATTIREQLAAHREIKSCATCHAKIDPPGFALESFDVMGGFRERYRSLEKGTPLNLFVDGKKAKTMEALPVDATGQMPNLGNFEDIKEFKKLLLSQEDQIARNLLEQLIIYNTGAPIGFADRPVVDQMMTNLKAKNYGIRSMIHEIVQSDLFRNK